MQADGGPGLILGGPPSSAGPCPAPPTVPRRDLARLLVILYEGATAMRLTEQARGADQPRDLVHHALAALLGDTPEAPQRQLRSTAEAPP